MGELDYTAGDENAPRDNSEEAAADNVAGGHAGETDLNDPASGVLADLQRLKASVDAAFASLSQALEGLASKAKEAVSATDVVPTATAEVAPDPETITEPTFVQNPADDPETETGAANVTPTADSAETSAASSESSGTSDAGQ